MWTVTFDNAAAVSEGEEIRISEGFRQSDSSLIAFTIENLTRGGVYKWNSGGSYESNRFLKEPIQGFVRNLEVKASVRFELVERMSPTIGLALRTIKPVIDHELYERTYGKDYDDTALNAFKVVEERIRAKIGDEEGLTGDVLITAAFNQATGKLIIGDTENERQSVFLLFKGANGIFRNPVAHKYIDDEDIAAFELVCLANKLLTLIEKADLREAF
jgi:uncharacterized protein (TIGR02391 family)